MVSGDAWPNLSDAVSRSSWEPTRLRNDFSANRLFSGSLLIHADCLGCQKEASWQHARIVIYSLCRDTQIGRIDQATRPTSSRVEGKGTTLGRALFRTFLFCTRNLCLQVLRVIAIQ